MKHHSPLLIRFTPLLTAKLAKYSPLYLPCLPRFVRYVVLRELSQGLLFGTYHPFVGTTPEFSEQQ